MQGSSFFFFFSLYMYVTSVLAEHNSLRQYYAEWRTQKGECTVKARYYYTIEECIFKKIQFPEIFTKYILRNCQQVAYYTVIAILIIYDTIT